MSTLDKHPGEEELMEFVLHGQNAELADHLKVCRDCSLIVNEFKEVKDQVTSIDEEEIPNYLESNILTFPKQKFLTKSVRFWFENPYLLVLITVFMLIVLWYLVGSATFK